LGGYVQSVVCGAETVVEEVSVDLWFDEDNVDEEDDKVVFNVLVGKLLAFVLRVRGDGEGGYALGEADVVLGVDGVQRGDRVRAFHAAE
jgi:hypothetical protein